MADRWRQHAVLAVNRVAKQLGGGGLMPPLAALLGRIFTPAQFGSAFGQLNLATLPLTFAAAPLVGLVFDWSAAYRGAFLLEMLLCAVALVLLVGARAALRAAHS
jgi:MFS family permease